MGKCSEGQNEPKQIPKGQKLRWWGKEKIKLD